MRHMPFAILVSPPRLVGGSETREVETREAAVGRLELREHVIGREEQRALTPDLVLQRLKDGNERFVANDLTSRNHSAMVRNRSRAA
jgi:carbonic anhydrase